MKGSVLVVSALVSMNTYAFPTFTIAEQYIGYYEYNGLITETTIEDNRLGLFSSDPIPPEYFIFDIGDPVQIKVSAFHFLIDENGERPDRPGFYRLAGSIETPNFELNVDDNLRFGDTVYSDVFSQQNPAGYFCCSIGGVYEDAEAFWNDAYVNLNYLPTGRNDLVFSAKAVGTTQFFPVPEPSSIVLLIVGLVGMGRVMFRLEDKAAR